MTDHHRDIAILADHLVHVVNQLRFAAIEIHTSPGDPPPIAELWDAQLGIADIDRRMRNILADLIAGRRPKADRRPKAPDPVATPNNVIPLRRCR
jgi:hypothetical protein